MGGRRVTVRRPRVRAEGGGELRLPSWEALSCEDPLAERAVEQMLVGVSTRKYGRSLEPVPQGIVARGTSKSAVSRRFVQATRKQIDELLVRDLSTLDLVAIMIDGICIDDHVMLVALGIETTGKKHVLGVREGATENAASCKALLADLVDRGVPANRSILAVIDGGKALAKSLRAVFGRYAVIQRCQAHKVRNVIEQLPEGVRDAVRAALRQAYRAGEQKTAKRLLTNLERRLRDDHPGAAASLAEGLDETITIKEYKLPEWLERTLSTTNAIENVMGSVRQLTGRVKRWKNGAMIVRWTATALLEAERRFHRVRDHVGLKKLAVALRARDAANAPVEKRAEVA
jgi:transposase-like protein